MVQYQVLMVFSLRWPTSSHSIWKYDTFFVLFFPIHTIYYYVVLKWQICIYQLTELHNQKEGDALTALSQTLKDVGMFKAPEERKTNQTDGLKHS